jgi:ribosomal protein L34
MLVAAESIDPNPLLLAVALAALAGAVVILIVLWLTTRPPRPPVGPVTMDPGSEPPAVVDLLTGGFEVEDDAVPATVVDLAARRWFHIEEVAGGNVIIRLRRREGRGELTRFETRVLRHIERHAVDGVAPAAALTLGPDGVSRRWWKGFVREVNRHGRDLGLCRRRWDFVHLAAIWAPIAVAWGLLSLTAATADRVETVGGWGEPGSVLTMFGFVGVLAVTAIARRVTSSDAQAETEAGMAAASRWLGVREYLAQTGSFDEATAASVVIWEQQLAHATAMGLAPVVQRQLPFETEHDRHAWSLATGRWRRVKIRYVSFRPGWGEAPWGVTFAGLVQTAMLAVVAWVGLSLARETIDLADLPEGAQEWLPLAGAIVAAIAGVVMLWTAAKVVLGALDLFPRREVEGVLVRRREYRTGHRLPRVLQWALWSGRDSSGMSRDRQRRRRYHLAIDDGTDDRLVAYRCRSEIFRSVRQGATVRARVSPRLGYVASIDTLVAAPAGPSTVVHELVEDAAGRFDRAAGAVAERLGDRFGELEGMVDEDGRPILDQRDDKGRTLRDTMAEAREELERLRGPASAGPTDSAGQDLLGGLMGRVSEALRSAEDRRSGS